MYKIKLVHCADAAVSNAAHNWTIVFCFDLCNFARDCWMINDKLYQLSIGQPNKNDANFNGVSTFFSLIDLQRLSWHWAVSHILLPMIYYCSFFLVFFQKSLCVYWTFIGVFLTSNLDYRRIFSNYIPRKKICFHERLTPTGQDLYDCFFKAQNF